MQNKYLMLETIQKELEFKAAKDKVTNKDTGNGNYKEKDLNQELKKQLEITHRIDRKVVEFLANPMDKENVEYENFWQYLHLPDLHVSPQEENIEDLHFKLDDDLSVFLCSLLRAFSGLLIKISLNISRKSGNAFFSKEEIEKLQIELEMAKLAYKHALILPDVELFPQKYNFIQNALKSLNLSLLEKHKEIVELKKELEKQESILKKTEEELKEMVESLEKANSILEYNKKSYAILEAQCQSPEYVGFIGDGKQKKEIELRNTYVLTKTIVNEDRIKSKYIGLLKSMRLLDYRMMQNYQSFLTIKELCCSTEVKLASLKAKHNEIGKNLNKARNEKSKIKCKKIKVEEAMKTIPETLEKIKKNLVLRVNNLKSKQACYQYLILPEGYVCVNFLNINSDPKVEAETIQVKIFLLSSVLTNKCANPNTHGLPLQEGRILINLEDVAYSKIVRPCVLNLRKNTASLSKFCEDIVWAMVQEKGLKLSEILNNYGKEIIENKEILKEYQLKFGLNSSVKTFLHSLRDRLGDDLYFRLMVALYWNSRQEHSVKFYNRLFKLCDFAAKDCYASVFQSSQIFFGLTYKLFKKYVVALSHQLQAKKSEVKPLPAISLLPALVICGREPQDKRANQENAPTFPEVKNPTVGKTLKS